MYACALVRTHIVHRPQRSCPHTRGFPRPQTLPTCSSVQIGGPMHPSFVYRPGRASPFVPISTLRLPAATNMDPYHATKPISPTVARLLGQRLARTDLNFSTEHTARTSLQPIYRNRFIFYLQPADRHYRTSPRGLRLLSSVGVRKCVIKVAICPSRILPHRSRNSHANHTLQEVAFLFRERHLCARPVPKVARVTTPDVLCHRPGALSYEAFRSASANEKKCHIRRSKK